MNLKMAVAAAVAGQILAGGHQLRAIFDQTKRARQGGMAAFRQNDQAAVIGLTPAFQHHAAVIACQSNQSGCAGIVWRPFSRPGGRSRHPVDGAG